MTTLIMIHLENAKRRMDERGASAVEYGLLVAGIAAVIVAIVFFLGDTITGAFGDTCDAITSEQSADGTAAAECGPAEEE